MDRYRLDGQRYTHIEIRDGLMDRDIDREEGIDRCG